MIELEMTTLGRESWGSTFSSKDGGMETRLWWFGHVGRRFMDSVVRRVDQMKCNRTARDRGIPKKL